ncbi:MAG: hypothetical protein ABIA63_10380 [bacterium]
MSQSKNRSRTRKSRYSLYLENQKKKYPLSSCPDKTEGTSRINGNSYKLIAAVIKSMLNENTKQ